MRIECMFNLRIFFSQLKHINRVERNCQGIAKLLEKFVFYNYLFNQPLTFIICPHTTIDNNYYYSLSLSLSHTHTYTHITINSIYFTMSSWLSRSYSTRCPLDPHAIISTSRCPPRSLRYSRCNYPGARGGYLEAGVVLSHTRTHTIFYFQF